VVSTLFSDVEKKKELWQELNLFKIGQSFQPLQLLGKKGDSRYWIGTNKGEEKSLPWVPPQTSFEHVIPTVEPSKILVSVLIYTYDW